MQDIFYLNKRFICQIDCLYCNSLQVQLRNCIHGLDQRKKNL